MNGSTFISYHQLFLSLPVSLECHAHSIDLPRPCLCISRFEHVPILFFSFIASHIPSMSIFLYLPISISVDHLMNVWNMSTFLLSYILYPIVWVLLHLVLRSSLNPPPLFFIYFFSSQFLATWAKGLGKEHSRLLQFGNEGEKTGWRTKIG